MRPLDVVEDVPGERLVLASRSGRSRVWSFIRDGFAGASKGARRLAAEIWRRPKSARDLFGSVGLFVATLALVALIVLAAAATLVGVALVVALYFIGVWLIAWWLVGAAASRVIYGRRSRSVASDRVRSVELRRDAGELRWRAARGSRVVPTSSVASLRALIEARPAGLCDVTLDVGTADGERAFLRLEVSSVDRLDEGVELCFRMARILGFGAYSSEVHRLLGLELSFVRAPDAKPAAHPFRGLSAEPEHQPIPPAPGSGDWSASPEAGFVEPLRSVPPLDTRALRGARYHFGWAPGTRVEIAARPRWRPGRAVLALAAAAAVGAAVTASVVAGFNLVAGLDLATIRGADGRFTPGGVLGWLTAASSLGGWVVAVPSALRRTGTLDASFVWASRELALRTDRERSTVPFDHIREVVLHELGGRARRYVVELWVATRAPIVLFESAVAEASDRDAHEPPLAMTIELARSLGVPWRCVVGGA